MVDGAERTASCPVRPVCLRDRRWASQARTLAFLVLLAGVGTAQEADDSDRPARSRPPNIVFVMADDLGYGELGSYGQDKIRTPSLDRLAAEGMRLTQHIAGNAVCAPSRCVLMTGMHPGHAQVRNNKEVKPEGQMALTEGTVTLANAFGEHGYATGAFGKWGLGAPGSVGAPLPQGFDRFYGYNCQRVAHNYYPTSLWDDEQSVALDNPAFPAHDKLKENEDPDDAASYARFAGNDYAPDLISEQALAFVDAHKDEPFFLYWPTVVPHLALQVPEDSLAEYAELWDDVPYVGGKGYLPHASPRAAYAAMITRMDRDIGRLMDRIHELGLDEDTLFVFTSDNGPTYDRLGGSDSGFFDSAAGLRGLKGSLYEGGVRVPCIVRWPGVIEPGSTSDHLTGFEDWLPTLLELTGNGAVPEDVGIDGISFAPTLRGERQLPRPFLYREFSGYGGQQSVRLGDWKAIRRNLRKLESGEAPVTELYDLSLDPAEAHDISAEHPQVLRALREILDREHQQSAAFPMPALDG
jgi:arylsulfatase A